MYSPNDSFSLDVGWKTRMELETVRAVKVWRVYLNTAEWQMMTFASCCESLRDTKAVKIKS